MLRRLLPHLPLLGALLLALALRLWGLGWGLPSATHYFSYHPDESMVLIHAMNMNLLRGDLLPHFYNYGSLQLYLVNFANTLAFLFGSGSLTITDFTTQYPQWAQLYLVGRGLTVAMGVGTVWATYALGARLWGRRAGVLAAVVLAVMPLHVQHSHWLTVDVPATFWGTLSLHWAARLATGDPRPLRAAVLAGVFAGLAAATKYNLALMLLPVALASLLPFPGREGTGRLRPGLGLLPGGAGAVLAFLLACPGAALDYGRFRQDFGYEAY
ncbi:MAG: glycosyltransferase family 39 protein, partial [Armatimonadetes bacterium]|nr:glycosyltransferase family 39 protein [Armatimonadota bacterium]